MKVLIIKDPKNPKNEGRVVELVCSKSMLIAINKLKVLHQMGSLKEYVYEDNLPL